MNKQKEQINIDYSTEIIKNKKFKPNPLLEALMYGYGYRFMKKKSFLQKVKSVWNNFIERLKIN